MSKRMGQIAKAPIKVLCVDDNHLIGQSISAKLSLAGGFRWLGQFEDPQSFLEKANDLSPDVVLLDADIPGHDVFAALRQLAIDCPNIRVLMLSGHVRRDLVEQAVEAGAWGYISKNDRSEHLIRAIQQVSEGEFVLGADVAADYRRR